MKKRKRNSRYEYWNQPLMRYPNGLLRRRKPPRKRCNRCEHFAYTYIPKTRKCGYICTLKGKQAWYTELVYCDKFQKRERP